MDVNKTEKIYFNLGYFRILQSLPGLQNVDMYINDKLVIQNLTYGNYTPYFPMVEDSYLLSLYPAGKKDTPILTSTLTIGEREFLTLATVINSDIVNFLSIPDLNLLMNPVRTMLRFVNLSPDTPAVDVTLPDGTVLFHNISYQEGSSYMPVAAQNYTLQIREAGTANVLVTVPDNNLNPNEYYTFYALGLSHGMPKLKGELLLDGFK